MKIGFILLKVLRMTKVKRLPTFLCNKKISEISGLKVFEMPFKIHFETLICSVKILNKEHSY